MATALRELRQYQNQIQSQYTFIDWYKEYLNNIVDGSVDHLGCGSALISLFMQRERALDYTYPFSYSYAHFSPQTKYTNEMRFELVLTNVFIHSSLNL